MTNYWIIAVVFSLALGAPPAHAQNVNDIRCLLASNLFVKNAKDQNAKRLADSAMHFYLGRIDGRFNQTQLRTQFVAQQKTITAANAGSTMRTCFQELQRSAKVIEIIGQQLAQGK